MGTPELALSVRQPWAWALIHGGKNVENRSQRMHFRGRICIHASKQMSQKDYANARAFMETLEIDCPPPADLPQGCIIGSVEVTDCTTDTDSDWFFGPYGIICRNPQPITPMGITAGKLGLFKWSENADPLPEPKPWMKKWNPEV